jgi:hypothetical protein
VRVVGLPGIGGWRASWASLFAGRDVRFALDRGKPDQRGIIAEDRAAARIALEIQGLRERVEAMPETSAICLVCGADEPWLCAGCGRRRAPEGQDWGSLWAGR